MVEILKPDLCRRKLGYQERLVGFGDGRRRAANHKSKEAGRVGERELPPRHTGRADFPHPAFPDTYRRRHTQGVDRTS